VRQDVINFGQQTVPSKHESARLEALRRSDILDTPAEAAFDDLTFLAAQICGTPIALIAVVDDDRCWFKSKVGLSLSEIRDDFTLCRHTLLEEGIFEVSDPQADLRFSRDLLLSSGPKVKFYAGTPLVTLEGFAVAVLCVMDHVPRTLTTEQLKALTILGRQASRLISMRHKDLAAGDQYLRTLLEAETDLEDPVAAAQRVRRNALLEQLMPALDQNELTVHFQPKLDLQSEKVTGFEALVRWLHPKLGFVLPDEFIPLAESSGQITHLTPWVIEQTLVRAHAAGWPAKGLQVAVNLSARNLHEDALPDRVDRILKTHQFSPALLMLEITESAVISDFAGCLATLNQLREIGVSLSVDDFGTGYSSLAYLKELPLQELKIDRALITNVHRCERDFAIVKFAVDLAHNLGMRVIGEGVEEMATLRTLAEIGCDGAQGFAIGRPMRTSEIDAWLQTH